MTETKTPDHEPTGGGPDLPDPPKGCRWSDQGPDAEDGGWQLVCPGDRRVWWVEPRPELGIGLGSLTIFECDELRSCTTAEALAVLTRAGVLPSWATPEFRIRVMHQADELVLATQERDDARAAVERLRTRERRGNEAGEDYRKSVCRRAAEVGIDAPVDRAEVSDVVNMALHEVERLTKENADQRAGYDSELVAVRTGWRERGEANRILEEALAAIRCPEPRCVGGRLEDSAAAIGPKCSTCDGDGKHPAAQAALRAES